MYLAVMATGLVALTLATSAGDLIEDKVCLITRRLAELFVCDVWFDLN